MESDARSTGVQLQQCKYQLSNSRRSNVSRSVVKEEKITVYNSHSGAVEIYKNMFISLK